MKKINVVIAVRNSSECEEISVFDSHDEVFGLYDYTEDVSISETTYNRLKDGYTACRYGNTIRAYSF